MRTVSKHDVPQWTFELTELCANLADDIAVKYDTHAHIPPLNGLNMSHSSIVQSFELLDYYYDRWGRVEQWVIDRHGPERIRRENEERVSLLQKSTFILIMSALEASAKMALMLPDCPVVISGGRVYLSKIMNSSHAASIICDDDADLWRFAIELRNCMVHNNAIADRTMRLVLAPGHSIDMVAGAMAQSTPRRSILLQKAVLLAYSRWCDAVLSKTAKAVRR